MLHCFHFGTEQFQEFLNFFAAGRFILKTTIYSTIFKLLYGTAQYKDWTKMRTIDRVVVISDRFFFFVFWWTMYIRRIPQATTTGDG
jgi:hypothetical protein